MFVEVWFVHRCCHDVRGVLPASDLKEFEVSSPESLLHPQISYGQVSYPAEPTASADADSCSRIRVDLQADGEAKVQT